MLISYVQGALGHLVYRYDNFMGNQRYNTRTCIPMLTHKTMKTSISDMRLGDAKNASNYVISAPLD